MGLNFEDVDSMFDNFSFASSKSNAATQQQTAVTTQQANDLFSSNVVIKEEMSEADRMGLLQSAQTKMGLIGTELGDMFMERTDVIRNLQLSLITQSNCLLYGAPGTAKSQIVQELCSRVENANYFQWMLNKTTDPSEILGPFSVKSMENDKFMRMTAGKLPEAHIAFLDEVYKSNSPTLNILLTIMNEHTFYNDGKAVQVPLMSLVGASNELPEDDTLAALHDRFLFRMKVGYIQDVGNKKRMHSNYILARSSQKMNTMKTIITIDELKELNRACKNVKVSKDIINAFIRLISALDREAIHVSDRRQNECFKVLQGSAVLRGATNVGLDDFRSLIWVLWSKEEEIPIVTREILKMVNPYDDKFKEIVNQFEQIKADIDNCTSDDQKTKKTIEAKSAIERLTTKLNKLMNEASKNGRDVNDFAEFKDKMVQYNNANINAMLGSTLFGIDDDNQPAKKDDGSGDGDFQF